VRYSVLGMANPECNRAQPVAMARLSGNGAPRESHDLGILQELRTLICDFFTPPGIATLSNM